MLTKDPESSSFYSLADRAESRALIAEPHTPGTFQHTSANMTPCTAHTPPHVVCTIHRTEKWMLSEGDGDRRGEPRGWRFEKSAGRRQKLHDARKQQISRYCSSWQTCIRLSCFVIPREIAKRSSAVFQNHHQISDSPASRNHVQSFLSWWLKCTQLRR